MDFTTDTWYRLTTAAAMSSQLSMSTTALTSEISPGSVTFGPSDNTAPSQQWQLFPIDIGTYILRCRASGPGVYLSTKAINRSSSDATPRMYNRNETNSSTLWRIAPWGDGTFYLSNIPTSKPSHLEYRGIDQVRMSKNFTQPQPGQAFSFIQLGRIDDSAYSTVEELPFSPGTSMLPSTTSATTTTNSLASSSKSAFIQEFSSTITSAAMTPSSSATLLTSPSHTSRPQSHNLSSSAAMGVGVSIGALGIICLTALGLFIFQQWRQRRSSPEALHYRRAKLWKGFTPEHRPSTIATGDVQYTGDVFVTDLPEVATPSVALGSPHSERHHSWQSFHSRSPPVSPFIPAMPVSPPIELPV